MKRFAKTISLAACLVFLCGAVAMAANSVVIESKTVAPNATGVEIGAYFTNDVPIVGMVLTFELRVVTPGSYIVAAFSRGTNPAGRIHNSALGPSYFPAGCNDDFDPSDCTRVPASVTANTYPNIPARPAVRRRTPLRARSTLSAPMAFCMPR